MKKGQRPPQSLDLSPMDYHVWDSLKEKAFAEQRHAFTDVPCSGLELWNTIEGMRKGEIPLEKEITPNNMAEGGPSDNF